MSPGMPSSNSDSRVKLLSSDVARVTPPPPTLPLQLLLLLLQAKPFSSCWHCLFLEVLLRLPWHTASPSLLATCWLEVLLRLFGPSSRLPSLPGVGCARIRAGSSAATGIRSVQRLVACDPAIAILCITLDSASSLVASNTGSGADIWTCKGEMCPGILGSMQRTLPSRLVITSMVPDEQTLSTRVLLYLPGLCVLLGSSSRA